MTLLLLAAACDRRATEPSPITVTDSAGVRIVRHSAAAVADAPDIALTEVVRIGTVDGPAETQFFRLAAAVEVGDEIYTLDVGDSRVRVFGVDGQFRRAFGRAGGGPGEFRRPLYLEVVSDTVVVQGERLNLLTPEGEALATSPGRMMQADGFLMHATPTAAGWMGEWYERRLDVRPGETFQESLTVYLVDPFAGAGALLTPVFAYARPERQMARGDFPFYLSPYFQSRPTHHIARDGSVHFSPGDAYRIDVMNSDGRLVRRIESPFTAPPVTSELIDRAVAQERERVADAPPGSESAMYARVIDDRAALDRPATLPLLGRMLVAPGGRLLVHRLDLVEDPLASDGPSAWDLFDPSGRIEGRVRLPARVSVLRLTDDGLLANVRDEADIHHLVKYAFETRSPDPR